MENKLRVISLFSGAGGMDLGFKQAGFNIIFANDFHKDACETYRKNIDNNILNCDIATIKEFDIPKDVDVLIGGFPCQGFSIANSNRNLDDSRNHLYKEMIRFIRVSDAKVVVAENVKGILSLGGGVIFNKIKKDLEDLGYRVDYKVLNTAYFGVPQKRERVIIIANKIGIENIFPKETHNKSNFISTKEVCGHLANVGISYDPIKLGDKIIYNHIAFTNVSPTCFVRKHDIKKDDIGSYLKEWREKSGISVKQIDNTLGYKYVAGHWFIKDIKSCSIPSPGDWWKLKEILKFDDKYDKQVTELIEKKKVFEQNLRIVNWETPSDTLTTRTSEIHINKERRLSVRECAIIQTFPDDFVFVGSLSSMHKQVGNAVPVKFANAIAKGILKMLC